MENNLEIVVTENIVKRDEYHGRQYEEWIITIGNFNYHIEKGDIQSQNQAVELAKEFNKKSEILQKLLNVYKKDINVNIVESNVKTGKAIPHAYYDIDLDGVYMHEYQLDDIYTVKALAEIMFDVHIPWLAFGIAGKVLEYETDEDALCLFYSDKDNLDILSLFGARFHEKVNNNVEMAINTAISFYRYLDIKYGEQIWEELAYMNSIPKSNLNTVLEKQEWLYSIGCDNIYNPTYNEKIMHYRCFYNSEYDILVYSGYANFYVKFYNNEGSIMKHSSILERLLNYNLDSYSRYMDLAQDEGFDEYIVDKPIDFYIDEENPENRTVTYTDRNKVLLFGWSFEYAHAHELAHAMIKYNNMDQAIGDISRWWLNEGYATYISATLPIENSSFSDWSGVNDADFDYVIMHRMKEHDFNGTTYPEMDNAVLFEHDLWNYYYKNQLIEEQSNFDKIKYYDAFAKAYMNTQDFNVYSADTPYELLGSFTKYIIDTYSWYDLVNMISNNISYKDALGVSFEKLIIEWKNSLVSDTATIGTAH